MRYLKKSKRYDIILLLRHNILTDNSKPWGSEFRGFVFILMRASAMNWWNGERNNPNCQNCGIQFSAEYVACERRQICNSSTVFDLVLWSPRMSK